MQDHIQYHRVADTSELILSDGFYSEFEFKPHYHLDYHIGLVIDAGLIGNGRGMARR